MTFDNFFWLAFGLLSGGATAFIVILITDKEIAP
jgi:hypothetical protein